MDAPEKGDFPQEVSSSCFLLTPLRSSRRCIYPGTHIYAHVNAIIAIRDKVPRVIIYSGRHLGKKIQIKPPKHGFNAYLYSAKHRHYRVLRSKWSLELFHCHLLRDFPALFPALPPLSSPISPTTNFFHFFPPFLFLRYRFYSKYIYPRAHTLKFN